MEIPIDSLTVLFLPRLWAMLALIVGATATGVIVSIVRKQFDWTRLADFLRTMVLPKLGGWLVLELLAFVTSEATVPSGSGWTHDLLVGLAWAAYSASFASLAGQILANLYELNVLPKATGFFARPEEKAQRELFGALKAQERQRKSRTE
jgi:hypothetical protein